MASKIPPVKGSGYTFSTVLLAQSDNQITTTPTLAAGDVKVIKDGGAEANITTLPSETPASSGVVSVALSASEMDADEVVVKFIDAAGDEWHSQAIVIHTAAQTFDTTDGVADAVKAKTDNLPASPAAVGSAMTLADAAITAAKIDTDAITAAKVAADAVTEIQSGLATSAALATVDGIVDTILLDTNELQTDLANGGRLDLLIDAILEDTGTTLPATLAALNDLSAAQVNAEVVDVVGTDAVEGTLTQRDILRVLLAFVAGTTTGGNTTSVTFKSQDGNTNRIVMTVDSDGDRSAVAVDGA